MLAVMQAFCGQWDSDTWQVAFGGALSYLFELPKTQLAEEEDAATLVGVCCTAHAAPAVYECCSVQMLYTATSTSHQCIAYPDESV